MFHRTSLKFEQVLHEKFHIKHCIIDTQNLYQ